MRTTALSALVLLGASLVASTPIRVVVTAHQEISSDGPFDGPLLAAVRPPSEPIHFTHIERIGGNDQDGVKHSNGRRPCKATHSKAVDLMNDFRAMLGFPLINPEEDGADHRVHILPIGFVPTPHRGPELSGRVKAGAAAPILPFVGTPVRPAFGGGGDRQDWLQRNGDHRMHRFRHHQGSFLRRVHHALMALGPWEGRAVAFVLGCGIGVLLRMMWVMVLITARAIRGPSQEDSEEDGYDVVFEDAELLVPPPQYTVLAGSEAVPVPSDEKTQKE
ncbi:hypothetical protein C2E23DRAFT_880522 [Lenzites betulinus]|nr:hypothetical protein C2E23DRAFT_880522 [Lenzites betulinus]